MSDPIVDLALLKILMELTEIKTLLKDIKNGNSE